MSASADTQAACRSRAITCEEMAAGFNPSRAQIRSFRLRTDVAEGADGAGNLADAQVFGGGVQTRECRAPLRRTTERFSGRK